MKTGITGITLSRGYFNVRWNGKYTTVSTIERAVQRLWEMKLPEMKEISAGKSKEWIEGYVVGLIHGGFLSEEESRYAADLYE